MTEVSLSMQWLMKSVVIITKKAVMKRVIKKTKAIMKITACTGLFCNSIRVLMRLVRRFFLPPIMGCLIYQADPYNIIVFLIYQASP